jgi:hypothetical protein
MTEPAPPGFDPNVQAYYDQAAEESHLEIGPFRLEQLRTRELILRHAPQPPAVVLDVGGAVRREMLLNVAGALESDPSVMGASAHLLAVGRR